MDAGINGADFANSQPVNLSASGDAEPGTGRATPPSPPRDTRSAVAFLEAVLGEGRVALADIDPVSGQFRGTTVELRTELARIFAGIEASQGKRNLYYRLNEPAPREQQKGKKGAIVRDDLSRLRGVVADIDPPKGVEAEPGGLRAWRDAQKAKLARLADDPHGPSALVDSGGGFQLIWLFRDFLPATTENVAAVEDLSKRLAHVHGGDATHDAVHLFRVPFTVNLPDARKRARGRKPAATWGCIVEPRRWHTLDGLRAVTPPAPPKAVSAPAPPFDTDDAWIAAGSPDTLSDELAEGIANARARHRGFDRLLSAQAPEAGSGARSEHDFAVACAAVEAGITDRADVAAIVSAHGSDKYEEKLEGPGRGAADAYLVNTVNKAFARIETARAAGSSLLSPVEDSGGAAGVPTAEGVAFEGEPLDIFGHDDPGELSTPPMGSLPDVAAAYVRVLAAEMGVPESFAAAAAVATLAGAIGNALTIRVRQHSAGYQPPASIAIAITAPPGRKKSPTMSAALAPLRALDSELHRASAAQRTAWRAVHCTAKGTPRADALPPPPIRQILVDDATIEKQVRIHADNPAGIIRAPDELSAFLGSMGAYKRNGDGDRGTLLTMLDGGPVSHERVSGSVRAESALMGLITSTQPDRIAKLTRDLGSDGFLQRILFVVDDGIEREPLDAPTDPEVTAEYARAVRGMAQIRNAGGGAVHLSPEARAILTATWRRIRALQALPGASAAWEGHVSKWEGFLYRIALTFHAVDTWSVLDSVPVGPGVPVTAETARRASRFALFLVRHALRFYGEYYAPAEHNVEAREIAGHLLAHPDKLSVTPRDIVRARRSLQGDRRLTLAAMGALENAGWVSVAARGAEGPTKWTVNPQVHARFAERAEREKGQRAQAQRQIKAAMSAREGLTDDV